MMTARNTDDLALPAFLRVTPEEMVRRRASWDTTPPRAVDWRGEDIAKQNAEREARLAAIEEEDRTRDKARTEKRRMKQAAEKRGEFSKPGPGLTYDPAVGGWVHHRRMSHAKYVRIMRELPTAKHRDIFEELFGHLVDKAKRATSPKPVPSPPTKAKVPATRKAAGSRAVGSQADQTQQPRANRAPPELVTMMQRPEGASIPEMVAAFTWSPKTASARISAVRADHTVVSRVVGDVRRYFIEEAS